MDDDKQIPVPNWFFSFIPDLKYSITCSLEIVMFNNITYKFYVEEYGFLEKTFFTKGLKKSNGSDL